MCTSNKTQQNNSSCQLLKDVTKKLFMNFFKCLIVQIHWLFDCFVNFAFGLYYDSKAKKVPPIKNPLLLDSATTLAEKIRKKKVSAEEVVKTFIERCKEVNGIINAIVEERYEGAIEEAKAVDELINKTVDSEIFKKTKPYLGVPFTTKESNEAKGLLHTMALVCRKNHRSTEDATAVKHLKDAGAIIIGKTNVPELNLWCESRNNVYGNTNNPYNTTRTVGGSSGGEGAIIASCGSAISLGSDIGGSTRMPAFFNGVFGHKPSDGLTPMKGIGIREEDYPNSMAQAGPICKKGEDLIPLLKVIIGDKVSQLKLDEPVDLKSLNIFYQEESGDMRTSKVNSCMLNIMKNVVKHLKEVTGSATKVKIPGTQYSFRLWRYWMTHETLDFKYEITNRKYRASAKAEIIRLLNGSSELTFPTILNLIDQDYLPKENPEWAETVTAEMKEYVLDKLGNNGVLLYPSSPTPASYHYSYFLKPYNFGYWGIFNVLRLPVCQVPLGLDKQGLPVGIQIAAAPYNDHLCIAVARELERVFGGWVPPS